MAKKKKKTEKVKSAKPQLPKQPKSSPQGAKVGKGNPPEHTRFAKGTSGNLKGRPKGSKNLTTILIETAKAPVYATIGGKRRKITNLVASAMQLGTKAAAGDRWAMGEFLDRIDEIEARAAAARPAEFPFTPGDIEVLREVYERMKQSQPVEASEE